MCDITHRFAISSRMSSSEDEDALLLVQIANLNAKKQAKQKRYWVHPLWQKNKKIGIFNV